MGSNSPNHAEVGGPYNACRVLRPLIDASLPRKSPGPPPAHVATAIVRLGPDPHSLVVVIQLRMGSGTVTHSSRSVQLSIIPLFAASPSLCRKQTKSTRQARPVRKRSSSRHARQNSCASPHSSADVILQNPRSHSAVSRTTTSATEPAGPTVSGKSWAIIGSHAPRFRRLVSGDISANPHC